MIMDSATISMLVNIGAAGAVIIVVNMFLKSNKERDAQWQQFFNALNVGNKEDILALVKAVNKLTEFVGEMNNKLMEHDNNVQARVNIISAAAKERNRKQQ